MTLAVVILTYNEEQHIERALASVSAIASEIFVIDSGSKDATVALAEAAGASVLYHPFENQARQFQWGIDNAPITADWIMRLDADEVVEPDLAEEIRGGLSQLPADVTGVSFQRKHIFMDRWIRHGGRYPLTMLRLWRRGAAVVEQRWMDEHMLLTRGRAVTFRGGFADHNLNDLSYFVTKHNSYASREAVDALSKRYRLLGDEKAVDARSTSAAVAGKRSIKEKVYNNLPMWFGPSAYFLYRYLFQLGFLDGKEGLIYHLLQGGWYRFLVAAKVEEWDRALKPLPDSATRLKALSTLSGLRIEI